jgi:hypothetical protein
MDWNTYFTYDPSNGKLFHKNRDRSKFSRDKDWALWNKRWAGKEISYRNHSGLSVMVEYKQLAAHRIIWEMMNGPIPEGMFIDHVNGDQYDNRMENIRLATNSQNNWNQKKRKDNTSGYKGVSRLKSGAWVALLKVSGKRIHVGLFRCPFSAYVAWVRAAKKHHGEFARLQ